MFEIILILDFLIVCLSVQIHQYIYIYLNYILSYGSGLKHKLLFQRNVGVGKVSLYFPFCLTLFILKILLLLYYALNYIDIKNVHSNYSFVYKLLFFNVCIP